MEKGLHGSAPPSLPTHADHVSVLAGLGPAGFPKTPGAEAFAVDMAGDEAHLV